MSARIYATDLSSLKKFFVEFPQIAEEAAYLALNQVSERKALPAIRKAAESQVNFPRGYLDQADRLSISRRARKGDLEVVITARDRPTSLARFSSIRDVKASRGLRLPVQVKRGSTKSLNKAFLVKLKNDNLGMAIRLPVGKQPAKAYKPVLAWGNKTTNVWLLYGPSVDQVVRVVAEAELPDIGDDVLNEFNRQFSRLSRRG